MSSKQEKNITGEEIEEIEETEETADTPDTEDIQKPQEEVADPEKEIDSSDEDSRDACPEGDASAEENPDDASGEEDEKEDSGIRLFGKKKDKKDSVIDELNDKIKRQMAEFENFRKRSEKEKASMYDMGASSVLEKILPVIDNFERGLDSAGEDAFSEGMKMIYKQLMTSLEEMGVEPIPAVGETFDPELHNAVMHEENDEAGENEITQELQKGYRYHDTVLRYSMVKVAN